MDAFMPSFPSRWVLESKKECPETVELNGRRYKVYGALAFGGG